MSNWDAALKNHLCEYYLFHILALTLMLPIWLEFVRLTLLRNATGALAVISFALGIMLTVAAAGLKHGVAKWKVFTRILLIAGLGVEAVCGFQLLTMPMVDLTVAILGFLSLAVATWWVIIYCVDLSARNKDQDRLIARKMLKYYVLSAGILYLPYVPLARHYRGQIAKFADRHSTMNALAEVGADLLGVVDGILWQMEAWLILLSICALTTLLYSFKRTKDRVKAEAGPQRDAS